MFNNIQKAVSLKAQRIIVYIPIINYSLLFIWLYNYSKRDRDYNVFLKSLIVVFKFTLPIVIIQIIISMTLYNFPIIISATNILEIYLVPFSLGMGLIKHQETLK